jgi:hypothetical protein
VLHGADIRELRIGRKFLVIIAGGESGRVVLG